MTATSALRQRIGWTTGELARRTGVNDSTARSWDIGRRNPPPWLLPWLERIAAAVEGVGLAPASPGRAVRG